MKTTVIFRKEKDGEICAFFPYEIADLNGNISCYAHIGQHSAASVDYYHETKPCTTAEYTDLMTELQSIGYELTIRQKMSYNLYLKAYNNLKPL